MLLNGELKITFNNKPRNSIIIPILRADETRKRSCEFDDNRTQFDIDCLAAKKMCQFSSFGAIDLPINKRFQVDDPEGSQSIDHPTKYSRPSYITNLDMYDKMEI